MRCSQLLKRDARDAQKGNPDVLVEYEEQQFSPKVLMNEPGYRMVLLSLRARQNIPEHASSGIVTLYVILGHITLFAGPFPDELYAGQVICIESGVRHRIEAFEDSALLVLFRRYKLLYGVYRRTGLVRGSETTTPLV
jgi:quercetin dioxygenase-like cupin family protein